jgi:nucleoside-diphosphate-sugar epimerase
VLTRARAQVVHCASPWHLSGKTWKDYRDPAVDGTVRLIKQAAEVPTVKHFTFISSFAAEGDAVKPWTEQKGVKYTESDWLPYDEQFCVQVEKEKK